MSRDYKGDCTHTYCSEEYCSELFHLVPNQNWEDEQLWHIPMTAKEAAVIAYVLGKHEAKDDERLTAVDIVLAELRDRL